MKTINLPFQFVLSVGLSKKSNRQSAKKQCDGISEYQQIEQMYRNIRKKNETDLKVMFTKCLNQCLVDTSF